MKHLYRLPLAALLALALAGCSGGDNGDHDAGPDDGDDQQRCGGGLPCPSSQSCVNDSMCVSRPDRPAEAFEEVWIGEDEKEFQERGQAQLGCHNSAPCSADADCPSDEAGVQLVCRGGFCGLPAPADGPETVTFRGCIDAFGIGDVTNDMRVALYRGNQDPTGDSQWDMAATEDRDGCRYWGAFEFSDVPTNTPLILKSYDDSGGFITTYKYNLVLWSDLAEQDGADWVFDTRSQVLDPRTGAEIELHPWRAYAISSPTYDVILMAVGISDLPETQGAIAGTIRDCAYHELKHVRCAAVDKPSELTYFTDSENPRPDQSRDASHVNGIYAAIGLEQGEHRVSCLAQNADGQDVPLGEYSVEVFPHGATILSFDWYPGVD